MKKTLLLITIIFVSLTGNAQQILSLDTCRALAIRNNKQLNATKLNQDLTTFIKKASRTKYLPKVNAIGSYQYFNREVSLLSDDQKTTLDNLGTNASTMIGSKMKDVFTGMVGSGAISAETAQALGGLLRNFGAPIAGIGDELGQSFVDALRTDNRNMWTGAIVLRQPIFIGGAVVATNKIADISSEMANDSYIFKKQSTLYNIDKTYWLVVSLKQKQLLATSYHNLIQKLSKDVGKLFEQGLATKAQELKVDVKLNEAEMKLTQAENGLSLARMLLCQLCGLPLENEIVLEDENKDDIILIDEDIAFQPDSDFSSRPEVRMMQNAVDLSRQTTNLIRAKYMPHLMLTGGYLLSNPNVFNGFQKKFSGTWNIGVTLEMPVWNWFEGHYQIKASETATTIAHLQLNDLQEKIDLQLSQCRYQLNEAKKRYEMASKNMKSAEENLRIANIGFKEGVIELTHVMEAQTAWEQAKSQKIDATIDIKLSQVNLKKALGILE